jgi:hypothetical protein
MSRFTLSLLVVFLLVSCSKPKAVPEDEMCLRTSFSALQRGDYKTYVQTLYSSEGRLDSTMLQWRIMAASRYAESLRHKYGSFIDIKIKERKQLSDSTTMLYYYMYMANGDSVALSQRMRLTPDGWRLDQ